MKDSRSIHLNRRQFVTTVLPACAATCLACDLAPALAAAGESPVQSEDKHKFDQPFERKLTYKQFFAVRYRNSIELAKALTEEIGKEKTIALLKKHTAARMTKQGQAQAKRSPDTNFSTYVATFKDPETFKNTLTMEIVEDTDTVFELKVTECLWAKTYLDADAGDIGYASVCYGDYAWAESFNPQIKMVRDKTLMEGAPICNHRYIWEPKKT